MPRHSNRPAATRRQARQCTALWRLALALACALGLARFPLPPARAAVAPVTRAPACAWYDPALRTEELVVARRIWRLNVVRRYAIVHPSPAYGGVWLRDSFWTLTALGDAALSGRALGHFAARQRPDGQVPTQFTTFLRDPIFHADESTLLFLIWSAWQARTSGPRPTTDQLRGALAYVRAQAPNGSYTSPTGSYADWLDSYRLKAPDTLAYEQGLYAVALLAARTLGLPVAGAEIERAIQAYRDLARPAGYLRFSRRLAYHDISGLTGEYLALWLFHRPLLDDAAVRDTLATQPAYSGGFQVLTDAKGHYLPDSAFVARWAPGDYQNGGSWLLYDYLALAAGYLHHVKDAGQRMHDRLTAEFRAGATFHEYLNTNQHAHGYGHEPAWRDGFSWDTFIVAIDASLPACKGMP